MCYGQSGTGKAHTLFGDVLNPSARESGMVQMALETIFAYIEATPEREFLVRLAYFEIIGENINDLCDGEKRNLQMTENLKVLLWRAKFIRLASESEILLRLFAQK